MPRGDADSYLRDSEGNFILDDYGNMIPKVKPPVKTNKMSSAAQRGKDNAMKHAGKAKAKRKAIAQVLTTIPASPTR